MFSISILGVVLAAIAYFIIGFLAHGPVTGKLWMKLANIHPTGNEKLSDMTGQMIANLITNIISAGTLAVLINLVSTSSLVIAVTPVCIALISAFILWIAIAACSSAEVIWMGRKKALWIFEMVSLLICFMAMALILVFV